MIIKNISGTSQYFGMPSKAKARGVNLDNNDTATLNDDPYTLAKVQEYVAMGDIQIIKGPPDAELVGGGNVPATGWIQINGATLAAETFTIGTTVFEVGVSASTITAGHVWAGAASATPSVSAAALVTHINAAEIGVTADTAINYTSTFYLIPLRTTDGSMADTDDTDIPLAVSGVNLVASGVELAAGVNQAARRTMMIAHTVTAGEDTNGRVIIQTGLPSITWYQIQITTAAGVARAYTGVLTISQGTMLLAEGTTVAGDIYYVLAAE